MGNSSPVQDIAHSLKRNGTFNCSDQDMNSSLGRNLRLCRIRDAGHARRKSTLAAIKTGVRKENVGDQGDYDRPRRNMNERGYPDRRRNDERRYPDRLRGPERRYPDRRPEPARRYPDQRHDPERNFVDRRRRDEPQKRRRDRGQRLSERRRDDDDNDGNDGYSPWPRHSDPYDGAPDVLPHRSATSQFLFGTSTVVAALRARRRQLHQLYILQDKAPKDAASASADDIRRLASVAGCPYKVVDRSWIPLFDRVSESRPHNGLVLEASALPMPPISSLLPVDRDAIHIDAAPVAPSTTTTTPSDLPTLSLPLPPSHPSFRPPFPFIPLIDTVLNPGNLGSLLRTAHFLGCPAVLLASRTCAPLNPATLKAASGAADALRIAAVPEPARFLDACVRNGWRVYGAASPEAAAPPVAGSAPGWGPRARTGPPLPSGTLVFSARHRGGMAMPVPLFEMAPHLLGRSPTIVLIGGEGQGLRSALLKRCQGFLGITPGRRARGADVGVDSLGVAVAGAVVMEGVYNSWLYGRGRREGVEQEAAEATGDETVEPAGAERDGADGEHAEHDAAVKEELEETVEVGGGETAQAPEEERRRESLDSEASTNEADAPKDADTKLQDDRLW